MAGRRGGSEGERPRHSSEVFEIDENENENSIELFDGSTPPSAADPFESRFLELQLFGPQRDWDVLDTCLNADNMKLVGNAYRFLKDRGFLPNFGKCRNIVLDGPSNITPDVVKSLTGLEGAHEFLANRYFSLAVNGSNSHFSGHY